MFTLFTQAQLDGACRKAAHEATQSMFTQAQLDEACRKAAHEAHAATLAGVKDQIKKLQAAATEAYEEGYEEGKEEGYEATRKKRKMEQPRDFKYKVEFWTLGDDGSPEWQFYKECWADSWDQIPEMVHDWETMRGRWAQSQLRIQEHQRDFRGYHSPVNRL